LPSLRVLSGLTRLNFRGNRLGADGVVALEGALKTSLRILKTLDIYDNSDDEGRGE